MAKVKNEGFPTFAVILLVIALIWFFGEMGIININIPWM